MTQIEMFNPQELRPYQQRMVDESTEFVLGNQANSDLRNALLWAAPTGCHARGERVWTHGGITKAVEDIECGDLLVTETGAEQVMNLVRGRAPLYLVKIGTDRCMKVNGGHILVLVWIGLASDEYNPGERYEISVDQYLSLDLPVRRYFRHALSAPETLGRGDILLVDPYLMGALLGDGSIGTSPSPRLTTADMEIAVAASNVAGRMGLGVHSYRKPGNDACWDITFSTARTGKARDGKRNTLTSALRGMGAWGMKTENKSVPEPYMVAPLSVRREILAGLIDTDGDCEGPSFRFTNTSRQLALDVTQLAWSCGLKARFAQDAAGTYRIRISGPCHTIPTKVARKKAKPAANPLLSCTERLEVTSLGEGEYFGFTLRGPSNCYFTDQFVLTHNCGKGTAELALQDKLESQGLDTWLLTPSTEIIRGFLERRGVDTSAGSQALADRAWKRRIATGARFLNRLLSGEISAPDALIVDEAHEFVLSNRNPETTMAIVGGIPKVGFTATPYRATPRATRELRELWGEPRVGLTLADAQAGGFVQIPEFRIEPLCNDDLVKIGPNGELEVKSVEKTYAETIEDAAGLIASFYSPGQGFATGLIVSLPSSGVTSLLSEALTRRGVPHDSITEETPGTKRTTVYQRTKALETCILQIGVLTRGADLPFLRVLIDMQPTMSPVRWMQTIGRIMRPGSLPPLVICTNRNLSRHWYLLEGFLPREVIVAEQAAFGGPSTRTGARDLGLEALGRLKRVTFPLARGGEGTMFRVFRSDKKGKIEDLAIILLPGITKPLVARSERSYDPESSPVMRKMTYSSWTPCEIPADFQGFATTPTKAKLSDAQREWWSRAAGRYGLDAGAAGRIDQRQFTILPLMKDLGLKLT